MVFRNRFLSFEECCKARLVSGVAQERKDLDDALSQYVILAKPGDSLHRPVPADETAIAIEREHAIDAGVDHLL